MSEAELEAMREVLTAPRRVIVLREDEAEALAYTLENGPDPDDSPEQQAETFTRAIDLVVRILRGETSAERIRRGEP